MKKMTQAQILRMLKDAAVRRYGKRNAKVLSPALRETAKLIAGEKNQDLALEQEPIFFSR
jgi:hypothetical protein